jgi:hypothetical protein
MPEPTAPEAPTEPTGDNPEAAAETPEPPAQETDWKAEARKWEQRAKENSTAAAQLAAIEEANKTEAQKLAERAENAEKALARQELEAARAQVALEKGLTASQAKRLVGESREEFLADADQLIADLGKQPTTPRPDPSQGVKGKPGDQSPAEAFAEIIRNQRGA